MLTEKRLFCEVATAILTHVVWFAVNYVFYIYDICAQSFAFVKSFPHIYILPSNNFCPTHCCSSRWGVTQLKL